MEFSIIILNSLQMYYAGGVLNNQKADTLLCFRQVTDKYRFVIILSYTFMFLVASGIPIDSMLAFPSVITMRIFGTWLSRTPQDLQKNFASANFKARSVLVPPM